MSPEEKLKSQRAAQLAADRALLRDLTDSYGRSFEAVRKELARLTKQIADARAAGVNVSPAWLFEQQRLQRFERELGQHIAIYLDLAQRKIEAARLRALISGQEDARSLLESTLPSGLNAAPALPVEQLERMVLGTRPGTPLGGLLEGLGERAAREAREKLIEGVALGLGTREIGRNLRDSFGGNGARSLLVARTEVIRTYRQAALRTYRQNQGVITGWTWIATLGPRTCAVCIAKHGSFHDLDEEFASHPACRCSPAPATKSWADLGFVDDDEQTAEVDAEKILGGGEVIPPAPVYYHGTGSSGGAKLSTGNADWDRRFFITPDKKVAERYANRFMDGAVREVKLDPRSVVFRSDLPEIESTPEKLAGILRAAEAQGVDAVHFGGGIGTVVLNEGRIISGGRTLTSVTTSPVSRRGLRETRLDIESGEAWFARQDAGTQRRILGRGKFELYDAGELRLEDVVQETVSPIWGRGLRERSLRDLVGLA